MLSELERARARTGLSWRKLCGPVAYSSVMRWRLRAQQGQLLLQSPGPKKSQPIDWQRIYDEIQCLEHGRVRTRGTTAVYGRHRQAISRRQLQHLAAQIRQQQIDSMKRIEWLFPGLAWGIDATEYRGTWKIIPAFDLACRYRFVPLVALEENGQQVADYLDKMFRQHGAPLFLKRDNGSPFNCEAVEQVLHRHGVLPLNNPPFYPRYNGAMEKSIRDLKSRLDRRVHRQPAVDPQFVSQVEATVHELNHQTRRILKGRTPCQLFHDPNRRLCLSRPARKKIFRLLLSDFGRTIGNMPVRNHRAVANAWRLTVEAWLRRQGLISIRRNSEPNVSTNFPKNWSHN